jgi:hypothetical protein
MKNPHPIELALIGAVLALWAVLELSRALVALVLVLTGWRAPAAPAPAAPAPAAPALATPALAAPVALESLAVRELRQLARTAGHRALARSGRRADLLAVLA